jgi:hypothetical protein
MLYVITKASISGVIIMAASETAKRSPTYGALHPNCFSPYLYRDRKVERFFNRI